MDKYTVTMTRSPDLSDDEVRRRMAQVYALLLDLGRQVKSDAPAESATTRADASGGKPVPGYQGHATSNPSMGQMEYEP
jgi:hypothetical protein